MALAELQTVVLATQHHVATGNIPSPSNTSLPGNAATQLNTVLGWIKYLGLAAAFVGLFLTAGKMAVSHRTGQGGEHIAGLGYVAGALILLGSASALIGFFG
jgi:hypothetical protein